MVGDSNSAYFHNSVKRRNHRSRIQLVKDCNRIEFEGAAVPYTFVSHYEQFLGVEGSTIHLSTEGLFGTHLDESKAEGMARHVTNKEIKSEIFSIGDNYSSGPDGFSASFFKHAWDIIGLADVVSINQSSYVLGRRISDNIMLTQELMLNYHRDAGPPHCAFKDSTEILEFKTSRDKYGDNGMSDPIGGLVFKGLRKIGW
ncbi:hypothetical protein Tco_1300579 [Tanacetum coccineum]